MLKNFLISIFVSYRISVTILAYALTLPTFQLQAIDDVKI